MRHVQDHRLEFRLIFGAMVEYWSVTGRHTPRQLPVHEQKADLESPMVEVLAANNVTIRRMAH
jgi:hypothetical protein